MANWRPLIKLCVECCRYYVRGTWMRAEDIPDREKWTHPEEVDIHHTICKECRGRRHRAEGRGT
jgi:hypothetical protein